MPAYFGEFSGEESEPHVPTPMETFGKYDKKSLMTGVVIGQGLKGRARAPSDAPPAGFPADLWEEAKERANAAMREIAAAESGSGSGSATPPDWQFDKDAFCFGLAVGRSLEGWEIDGGLVMPAMVMFYIHLDDPATIYSNCVHGEGPSLYASRFVDWGDGKPSSNNRQHDYAKAGDYIITVISEGALYIGGNNGYGVRLMSRVSYSSHQFPRFRTP